jgi:hypothetical protein
VLTVGEGSVDWKAYLAGLGVDDRTRAERLAAKYGQETASCLVRYHPVSSLDNLESALRREHDKVRTQVLRLYESIDTRKCPAGWTITNELQKEADGTLLVRSDVIGPNGATGLFERGYNPGQKRIELRNAFLRLNGMTDGLPGWVTGTGVPMVAKRGTPTVQYFTLYQLKLLKVPAGQVRAWRRLLCHLRLRTGPFAARGRLSSIKMSTIQNLDSIVHLHWLRQRFPGADLSDLVVHTASVDYASTTAVQCGYRVLATKYRSAGEWEDRIGVLMDFFEAGNPRQIADNNQLLARFSLNRQTVMKQNFGIELSVGAVE